MPAGRSGLACLCDRVSCRPRRCSKTLSPLVAAGQGVFVARKDAARTTVASMPRFFHPLLHCFANARHKDLVAQVEYLKAENQVLRSRLPTRITVTPPERKKLEKLGGKVGPALKHLITVVSHRTFQRWVSESKKGNASASAKPKRRPGRPRTPEEVQQLVVRIARETGWGYTRILGELKKLGIRNVGKTTIRNILKDAGFEPGPGRSEGSWNDYLKMHAKTLWACDFVSKKVWTLGGLTDCYVLVFIHLKSRKVIASSCTFHPDGDWVAQQARTLTMDAEAVGEPIGQLIHDYDTKFTARFESILKQNGIEPKPVGPMKPNLNAYAERFIQTLKQECLDHFLVLGQRHLDYLVQEFVEHYNTERPHMSLGRVPSGKPAGPPGEERLGSSEVVSDERLGGLLRSYRRAA